MEKENTIKKSISIFILMLFLIFNAGCNNTDLTLAKNDGKSETLNIQRTVNENKTWHEYFLSDIENKWIGSINQITIKTDQPNTAGFRLLLLTFDQLGGVKWPKVYVIPFSTDGKGNAEIQLDYLFPEKELNPIRAYDLKVYHPILSSHSNSDLKMIDKGHLELSQNKWSWRLSYLYNTYFNQMGNIQSNIIPSIKPKLDPIITAYSFYELAGRVLGLDERLIPHELSVLTGKDAYLAYIASDKQLSKYASLNLHMPENSNHYISKAEAVAYLVRLYGFDDINVDPKEYTDSEKEFLMNHQYGNEWEIAIDTGLLPRVQNHPDDNVLKGDDALNLITDWIEHFSLLPNSEEVTLKILTKEELQQLYDYGLTNDNIVIIGYKGAKSLLVFFKTEIINENDQKIVIESFLQKKCATIDKNKGYCPDGSKAVIPLDHLN